MDTARQFRGQRNYLNGLAAEAQIARHYEHQGYSIMAMRWRGKSGELDLVACRAGEIVFVEVKSSKTHADATLMVTPQKLDRIMLAAAEFLGGLPDGELTPSRVDVACVDRQGAVEVVQNVIGH
jgi:putative endonuclease